MYAKKATIRLIRYDPMQTKHMEICMTPTTTMPNDERERVRKNQTVHIQIDNDIKLLSK